MKKSIKILLSGLLIVPVLALAISSFTPMASSVNAEGAQEGANIAQPDNTPSDITVSFKNIANVALYIIGAISVLMLIYGGIRYTVSGGDSAAVTSAKNTIMYAIIGVIVALLAYAIVNFVLTSIK
jgi:hypothetical protein